MAEVRTRKRGKTWSYIFEAGKQNGKRRLNSKDKNAKSLKKAASQIVLLPTQLELLHLLTGSTATSA